METFHNMEKKDYSDAARKAAVNLVDMFIGIKKDMGNTTKPPKGKKRFPVGIVHGKMFRYQTFVSNQFGSLQY